MENYGTGDRIGEALGRRTEGVDGYSKGRIKKYNNCVKFRH